MRLGASSAPRRTGVNRFGVFNLLIISPVVADKMCFRSGYKTCEPGRGWFPRTLAPQPPASALPRVRIMLTIMVTLEMVWRRLGYSLPPPEKPLVPVWKRTPTGMGGCPNRRWERRSRWQANFNFGFKSNPYPHLQRPDLKALILLKAIHPFIARNWRRATRRSIRVRRKCAR
jgi:hypothetical protein